MTWHQKLMAACLWADGAMVSELSAAALWGIDGFRPGPVMLIGPRQMRLCSSYGLTYRHISPFPTQDHRMVLGIPVTSVPATLLGLARHLDEGKLEEVLDECLLTRRTSVEEIRRRLAKAGPRTRWGAKALTKMLSRRGPNDEVPDSPLEGRFYRLVERSGIQTAHRRHLVIRDAQGRRLSEGDLVFQKERVVVLVDGYRWHGGRKAFDRELHVRNGLLEAGWRVMHVTSQMLETDPHAVCERLRRVLGRERHQQELFAAVVPAS